MTFPEAPQKLEVGEAWGFADPCEATAYPMTLEEYGHWFGVWQCTPAVQFLHDFGDDEDWFWASFDAGERGKSNVA